MLNVIKAQQEPIIKLMSKPYFSVIIPTFNRAKLLKATLQIILAQTFQDFEIIVLDNCSSDDTEKVVKSLKSKKIKYFKNKENIIIEKNIKKSLALGQGSYLFTTGDDDFILFSDTLEKVKEILEREKVGYIRLNLIEKKFIGKGLRKSIVTVENDIKIDKNSSPERVIEFFHKIGSGHIAGLVMKNSHDIADAMIDCPDVPWIKIIYDLTQKYGAYFLSNFYMIITWSQGAILNYYDVLPGNRLMFEDYTQFVFKIIPKKDLSLYKLRFYSRYIILQPVIKLYSSNMNLIRFNKKLMQLEPRLKNNISFWLFFFIALVIPKFIWRFVRVIQHKSKDTINTLKNKDKIFKRFNVLDRKYYASL